MTLFFVLLGVTAVHTESRDDQFVTGLQQRRLFRLAEYYCLQQIASSDVTPVRHGRLVEHLIHGYTLQALNAPADQRAPMWEKGSRVATRYTEEHPKHPRVFLVRMQALLMALDRARLTRQETEVGAAGRVALNDVRTLIRVVVNGLDKLDQDLQREIPRRSAATSSQESLGSGELLSLQNHVRYRLARALRERALCYPVSSPDRDTALTEAIERLKGPLTVLSRSDSLYWTIRLEQVSCYRLRGSLKSAGELIQQIDRLQPAGDTRRKLRVEAARLSLSAGRAAAAWDWLERASSDEEPRDPDLDQAKVEVSLALWRSGSAAKNDQETQKWRDRAIALAGEIERLHGPYWSHRASLLLVNNANRSDDESSVGVLELAARNLWRSGRHGEAIEAYDKASRLASETGSSENAFRLSFSAALIEEKRERFQEAILRYRKLAMAKTTHPQSSTAHYRAVVFAYDAARRDPSLRSSVEQLVDEHLSVWPQSSVTDSVRWLKGKLCEARRAWSEALVVYRSFPVKTPDAMIAAARCWKNRMSTQNDGTDEYLVLVDSACSYFEHLVLEEQRRLPGEWSSAARQAVVEGVRFRLLHLHGDEFRLHERLAAASAGLPPAPLGWQKTASMLDVVVAAAQPGQHTLAREMLREIGDLAIADWLEMIEHLDRISRSVDGQFQRGVAVLQLAALARSDELRNEMSDQDRSRAFRFQARALSISGQHAAAVTAFQRLVKEHPRDGALLEDYAQLLLDGKNADSWQQSVRQWRMVKQRSRPGSKRRLRATYALALAHFKLGDKQRAARIIRIAQATADLSTDPIAGKFAALLKRCE